MNIIISNIIEALYICGWIYLFYIIAIYPLEQDIRDLKEKQNTHFLPKSETFYGKITFQNTDTTKSKKNTKVEDTKYNKQNNITFPHFRIYRSNIDKPYYSKHKHKIPSMISKQLCDFLDYEYGTCMFPEDVHDAVFRRIRHSVTKNKDINVMPKLQELFGITDINNLQELIEPHIRD